MAFGIRAPAFLLALVTTFAAANDGLAESLAVRSGEHSGFSRLALTPRTTLHWQFGRTEDGYELRLDRPDLAFDISHVFAKIPRTRIADIRVDGDSLRLTTKCNCHAIAQSTAGGTIVIDVADGPAQADSPFEKLIAGEDLAATDGKETRPAVGDAPAGVGGPPLRFLPDARQSAGGTIAWRLKSASEADPAVAAQAGQDHPAAAKSVENSSRRGRPSEAEQLPADSDTGVPPTVPLASPAPEISQTEREILRELGRAATQGLIRVPDPVINLPKPDERLAIAPAQHFPEPRSGTSGPYTAIRAETAADRDRGVQPQVPPSDGKSADCSPDADLALISWGTDADAAAQLSDARRNLIGEFDRPDPEAIARLARLYLYFGLGAEARQALAAFGADQEQAGLLADVAHILDGEPVSPASPLLRMTSCGGAAALWAFLAVPDASDVRYADHAAIVRTFSGLPPHLRGLLGQRLAERLIDAGASGTAKEVRNAVARRGAEGAHDAGLIDAKVDLNSGRPQIAERELSELGAVGKDRSEEAMLLALQSRIDRGEPVNPRDIDWLAALAFENRSGEQASLLADLEIRARALAGDFRQAFEVYAHWREFSPGSDRRPTARVLFGQLGSAAPDGEFAYAYFRWRDLLPEAEPDTELRLDLADRLSAIGFAEDVASVLQGAAEHTDRGRLLAARAALDLGHSEDALARLGQMAGIEAAALRVEARRLADPSAGDPSAPARSGSGVDALSSATPLSIEAGKRLLGSSADLRTELAARMAEQTVAAKGAGTDAATGKPDASR